ncbi:MAG: hypothetical protein UU81_C0018G0011 [Microgenomates group bacterium GW2011_GWC1_41_8]|uniref:DUF3800 domain-containing protein n=1 Tax=Candidatus Roizmanbacteria bacterium GW2011_GWB1_40_7 TaxID=1618482 RepID=A0A0G0T5R7_9BACT|nr:MAG: hypothetical protein UU14_C0006G0002 [Candidatus Roizmanbacteria bacterium GW2011_GWB1_40_7]KKS23809.1 MAG: hypothetical protein UU81_C0018G0011 [Microgenomates group bacterium GW2011_GWC1_41_8]
MHIFLDESGTLTKSDGTYFIVGSFTVGDPRRIAKAFRKWQQNKFPRRLKRESEVKFNNTSLDDILRFKTLQLLVKQDIRIFYTFLKKRNIPEEYMKKGKVVETGLLYAEVVASTLELYPTPSENEFRVIRDQRTLKGVNVKRFGEILTVRLLPNLPAKVLFQVQAVDSTTSPLVQVADWICGALARYREEKPFGEEFYSVLKGNIVEEKELFSDKWTKLLKE